MAGMPESSLEIVRRLVDAFNRGAFSEGFSFYDPDVVLDNRVPGSISGGTYLGRGQVAGFFVEWGDNFEPGSVIEIEEALEQADQVAVCLRFSLRGRSSGVPVESRRWYVYRVLAERIVRIAIYTDREQALAAAGIAGRGPSEFN
jgi:ketosteroid isomerase-like protein